jgi:YetA-like protein
MSDAKLSVPLIFSALEAVPRTNEPVTIGLPWPRGAVTDEGHFHLLGPDGNSQTLQTTVLDRWPDGSVRWCLFEFLATWDGVTATSGYRIVREQTPRSSATTTPIPVNIEEHEQTIRFRTKAESQQFQIQLENWNDSTTRTPSVHGRKTLRSGAITQQVQYDFAPISSLQTSIEFTTYSSTPIVRCQYTIQNPAAAQHPGGNWDLGGEESVFLRRCLVRLVANGTRGSAAISTARRDACLNAANINILQASSGGDQWNSANHLTMNRKIELPFRGFEQVADGVKHVGNRATPIVTVETDREQIGVTMPAFWENFPKRIVADGLSFSLELFPEQPYPHEIQGGEQKTHTFYLALGFDTVTQQAMAWCRSPIVARAEPHWYAQSEAIPHLTSKADDPHADYLGLVDQAIDGPDTFVLKRERIDEYGWRHFGDIWGDHEAVFDPGNEPMISHYNNQYDCVAAFMCQFLRSSDARWLSQGLECAEHTCDIDVYHTMGDKSAYNGGLFWHTYHYAPADTGTHRSYPRSLRTGGHFESGQDLEKMGDTGATLKSKIYSVGGGPSAAHNYNHGLMLAYFLTGNSLFRDTAMGLAKFVLNMDDGKQTVFRWLCTGDTGLSIQSSDGYLGPGRASANSLLAVLVGHQLSGKAVYLDKADQIVRRVVHPMQNLERLDLLNAELRWFYTMFLQALGRYLDYKVEIGQLDEHYTYGRLSILHYARYMAMYEHPILDRPEKLQYPTETWAAQDMRKVEVFQYAAKHATGAERGQFLERAEWFFDYVVKTLHTFPPTDRGISTKSLCRPVILMMKYGWSRNWWKQNPNATAPEPLVRKSADEFGSWSMFVPQKTKAIKRAKRLIVAGAGVGCLLLLALIWWLIR